MRKRKEEERGKIKRTRRNCEDQMKAMYRYLPCENMGFLFTLLPSLFSPPCWYTRKSNDWRIKKEKQRLWKAKNY